jgi:DNA modification methylase
VISLFNEDCFDRLKQIDDDSIDAIITDPPYGILNHKIETNIDIERLMKEWQRVLKNNGFLVYFGRQPTFTEWNHTAFKYFKYKKEIIWYKKQRSTPNNDIGNYFENIMVCSKGNNTAKFNKTYIPYTDVLNSMSDFNDRGRFNKLLSSFNVLLKNDKSLEELRTAIFTDTRMYERKYDNSKKNIYCKTMQRI